MPPESPESPAGVFFITGRVWAMHAAMMYVNGPVDDFRLADVSLVFCGRNLDILVAWHELTHQKPAFLVAVGDTRDFRLGPFEINQDAPLALFAIPYGHPLARFVLALKMLPLRVLRLSIS